MVLSFMASVEGPSIHSSSLRIVFQITGAVHAGDAAGGFLLETRGHVTASIPHHSSLPSHPRILKTEN